MSKKIHVLLKARSRHSYSGRHVPTPRDQWKKDLHRQATAKATAK